MALAGTARSSPASMPSSISARTAVRWRVTVSAKRSRVAGSLARAAHTSARSWTLAGSAARSSIAWANRLSCSTTPVCSLRRSASRASIAAASSSSSAISTSCLRSK
jgi:hypothetical protein